MSITKYLIKATLNIFGLKLLKKRTYEDLVTKLQEFEDSNMKNQSSYNQDGLSSQHNNDFMSDPAFIKAYNRGVQAVGFDYNWHWRVHIGLWAARTAVNLDGDFVECGVNAGFLSSSIMYDLRWDSTGKIF